MKSLKKILVAVMMACVLFGNLQAAAGVYTVRDVINAIQDSDPGNFNGIVSVGLLSLKPEGRSELLRRINELENKIKFIRCIDAYKQSAASGYDVDNEVIGMFKNMIQEHLSKEEWNLAERQIREAMTNGVGWKSLEALNELQGLPTLESDYVKYTEKRITRVREELNKLMVKTKEYPANVMKVIDVPISGFDFLAIGAAGAAGTPDGINFLGSQGFSFADDDDEAMALAMAMSCEGVDGRHSKPAVVENPSELQAAAITKAMPETVFQESGSGAGSGVSDASADAAGGHWESVFLHGLNNLGNSCYLNALIQAVLRCSSVNRGILLEAGRAAVTSPHAATSVFSDVFSSDVVNFVTCIASRNIKEASAAHQVIHQKFTEKFRFGFGQQDAQEGLNQFLDSLPEALNKTWSLVTTEKIHCAEGECGRVGSPNIQPAGMLILPIEASNGSPLKKQGSTLSLVECLNKYFKPEAMLVGTTLDNVTGKPREDGFVCDRCHNRGTSIKTVKLSSLSPTLIINLKRFKKIVDGPPIRLDTEISIPETLTVPTGVNILHADGITPRMSDQGVTYYLTGIINHMGTPGGGHYTAHVRDIQYNSETKAWRNGTAWFKANDSRLEKETPNLAANTEGYLLIYSLEPLSASSPAGDYDALLAALSEKGEDYFELLTREIAGWERLSAEEQFGQIENRIKQHRRMIQEVDDTIKAWASKWPESDSDDLSSCDMSADENSKIKELEEYAINFNWSELVKAIQLHKDTLNYKLFSEPLPEPYYEGDGTVLGLFELAKEELTEMEALLGHKSGVLDRSTVVHVDDPFSAMLAGAGAGKKRPWASISNGGAEEKIERDFIGYVEAANWVEAKKVLDQFLNSLGARYFREMKCSNGLSIENNIQPKKSPGYAWFVENLGTDEEQLAYAMAMSEEK